MEKDELPNEIARGEIIMEGINKNSVFRELVLKFKEAINNENTVAITVESAGFSMNGICDVENILMSNDEMDITLGDLEFVIDLKRQWKAEILEDLFRIKDDVTCFEFVF